MGKQTGNYGESGENGEAISSQTNGWDGNAIFSVEPIGTGTQLIYPLKPKRKGTTITLNCLARNGDAGYIFWGTQETGTKYIVSLRNVRDGNGKSKAAPGTKGVGTGNGSQFANRK